MDFQYQVDLRMKLISSLLMAGAFVFAMPAIGAQGADKDLASLQGVWETLDFRADGDVAPDKLKMQIRLVFKQDRLQILGLSNGGREYSIKLDPEKKPKVIFITPIGGAFKDQTVPGIYEVEGNNLKFVMPNQVISEPPKAFEAPKGSNLALFVSKRSK